MADEKLRTTLALPKFHGDWLKIWAWLKGRGFTTMASDIIQARVEANLDEINRMLDYRAEQKGISKDELMSQILSDTSDD